MGGYKNNNNILLLCIVLKKSFFFYVKSLIFQFCVPLIVQLYAAFETVFVLFVHLKLSHGSTFANFVPQNGHIWGNLEYETVVAHRLKLFSPTRPSGLSWSSSRDVCF